MIYVKWVMFCKKMEVVLYAHPIRRHKQVNNVAQISAMREKSYKKMGRVLIVHPTQEHKLVIEYAEQTHVMKDQLSFKMELVIHAPSTIKFLLTKGVVSKRCVPKCKSFQILVNVKIVDFIQGHRTMDNFVVLTSVQIEKGF